MKLLNLLSLIVFLSACGPKDNANKGAIGSSGGACSGDLVGRWRKTDNTQTIDVAPDCTARNNYFQQPFSFTDQGYGVALFTFGPCDNYNAPCTAGTMQCSYYINGTQLGIDCNTQSYNNAVFNKD